MERRAVRGRVPKRNGCASHIRAISITALRILTIRRAAGERRFAALSSNWDLKNIEGVLMAPSPNPESPDFEIAR